MRKSSYSSVLFLFVSVAAVSGCGKADKSDSTETNSVVSDGIYGVWNGSAETDENGITETGFFEITPDQISLSTVCRDEKTTESVTVSVKSGITIADGKLTIKESKKQTKGLKAYSCEAELKATTFEYKVDPVFLELKKGESKKIFARQGNQPSEHKNVSEAIYDIWIIEESTKNNVTYSGYLEINANQVTSTVTCVRGEMHHTLSVTTPVEVTDSLLIVREGKRVRESWNGDDICSSGIPMGRIRYTLNENQLTLVSPAGMTTQLTRNN